MQSQKIYVEPEKKLPVSYDVDVLVCGGGPSGIAAAVSAAKNGAEVLLIERFNCLGGSNSEIAGSPRNSFRASVVLDYRR